MWVFIKGISDECSARELTKIVSRVVKPGWSLFSTRVNGMRVERSKILKTMYNKASRWEYHGLVYVNSPDSVHELIGRLNATWIKGRILHAHPYIRRQSSRDRRKLVLDQTNPFPDDRRKSDRRRGNLVSQVIDSMN
jgi:hypothetical protein